MQQSATKPEQNIKKRYHHSCQILVAPKHLFRSGLTFACGIAVYLLMWLLLHLAGSDVDSLGPGDDRAFSVRK